MFRRLDGRRRPSSGEDDGARVRLNDAPGVGEGDGGGVGVAPVGNGLHLAAAAGVDPREFLAGRHPVGDGSTAADLRLS
jgi:hypothetical protein